MSFKRNLVRCLVRIIDGWNKEIHQVIEERVSLEHRRMFPPNADDDLEVTDKRMQDMRAFYYARMSTTASLMIAAIALLVAAIAFLIAVLQLFQ